MVKRTLWLNYLRPNAFIRSLNNIDVNSLRINGVKLVICDLDNTLVPHFTRLPNREVYEFIAKIKSARIDFVIASNNTKKRVETFAKKMKEENIIDDYLYSCKKPFVSKLKKYIKSSNHGVEDVMIIGDQFITDIFVANRLKAKSILVLPLVDSSKTVAVSFFFKIIEKIIYKRLQHENLLSISGQIEKGEDDEKYELL